MAFTLFNVPETETEFPFSSLIISPVTESPFRFTLPASRTSKAMLLALLVEVVFRFILYATKKSRAPITVAPLFALNLASPKSGFHSGFKIFSA